DQGGTGRGTLGSTFGKSNGLGDLIAVAETPPLEIGNRIFRDNNRNGVQDANEPGLGGVSVELWLPGGAGPLANIVTAADAGFAAALAVSSSLSGSTYFDPNLDGQYTPGVNGDAPFGGITVTLTGVDPLGAPLPTQTTVSDKNGFYQFLNLSPGNYTITET